MRSDGSLMSEMLTRDYPVETLLSGPAASVVGGSVLAGEKDAVIVDMGGTTTDIALIRNGRPIPADRGISIGKWKTTVKGIYVETFLLGGDSAVRFQKGRLCLDGRRVVPLSLMAKRHPETVRKLQALAALRRTHTRMLHEFYVLLKDISGSSAYTAEEKKMCIRDRDNTKVLMRKILSREEAEKLLEDIPEIEQIWIPNEKLREEQYKEVMRTCDCRQWIGMMKTLYRKRLRRLAPGRKFTAVDERYLKEAEEHLYDELSLALGAGRQETEERIIRKLKQAEQSKSSEN